MNNSFNNQRLTLFLFLTLLSCLSSEKLRNIDRSSILAAQHASLLELAQTTSSATSPKQLQCDLTLSQGFLCYSNGEIISNMANVQSLVGFWGFDSAGCLDTSGQGNHAFATCERGAPAPGVSGVGNSINLSGSNYLQIPHNANFDKEPFTITLWLFWISNSGSATLCPILQKGKDEGPPTSAKTVYERAPGLMLNEQSSNLQGFYSSSQNSMGQTVVSNGKLIRRRWVHITLARTTSTLQIYWNGILDSVVSINGIGLKNTNPLYLGGSPLLASQCNNNLYYDNLKWYSKQLAQDYIQADAAAALGGVDASLFQLGCVDCQLNKAAKSCITGFHLCTNIELNSGGQMAAIANGWIFKQDQRIWSHGVLIGSGGIPPSAQGQPQTGLGLCCRDIK